MMIEIERKFLVKGDFKPEAYDKIRIRQGYLCSTGRTVRVRTWGDTAFLTIKDPSDAAGLSRFEWEKEIPVEDALQLLDIAEPGIIDKTRYLVKNTDGCHIWEIDEFHGENDGLIVAEIELGSEDEKFAKPEWLGEEVTGDRRYYNSHLSKNPFKNW